MQSTLIGWVTFIVLGALISVTSCQAWYGGGSGPAVTATDGSTEGSTAGSTE